MKKVIAIAIATAMVAPAAFAAEDEHGMRYTSASEGLYGSIRTEFNSRNDRYTRGGVSDESAQVVDGNSRWGFQGTNDLGNHLEGFYRYEANLGANNGDINQSTRLRYVGIRGPFGDFRAGTDWAQSYNFVTSKSDLSPNESGRFAWRFRVDNSLFYTTPDLNGFQAGIRLGILDEETAGMASRTRSFTGGTPNEDAFEGNANVRVVNAQTGVVTDAIVANVFDAGYSSTKTDNQIDHVALSGQYSVAGFNVAGTYERIVDGLGAEAYISDLGTTGAPDTAGQAPSAEKDTITSLTREDQDRWAIGASYAQDNWYVAGWYGEEEQRNVVQAHAGATNSNADNVVGQNWNKDREVISLGGNVTVDKVVVFAVWEQRDNNFSGTLNGAANTPGYYEDSGASIGVLYNIGAKSRVWVEYVSEDNDQYVGIEDAIVIGMRHDF